MSIEGNYRLKKAFAGFDDNFEMKFITRDEALALKPSEDADDGTIMAMMYARMDVVVTESNILLKFDTEYDDIAKQLAEGNGMQPNDGKYFIITYNLKKKGKKYQISSEDDGDAEVEFKDNEFELLFNTFERI